MSWRIWLCGEGVPSHAVRLEDRSQNTMENIRYAAALLGDVKERRLLVVTSDYHLHRAKATARRLGLGRERQRSQNAAQRFLVGAVAQGTMLYDRSADGMAG